MKKILPILALVIAGLFVWRAAHANIQNRPTPVVYVPNSTTRTNVLQDEFSGNLIDESKGQNLLPEQ